MDLRIREFRKARGLTLTALATKAGISQSYLSQLERNDRRANADVLERLAAGLEVEVADLLAPRISHDIPVLGVAGTGGLITLQSSCRMTCPTFVDHGNSAAILIGNQGYEPVFVKGEAVVFRQGRDEVTADRSRPVICETVDGDLRFAQLVDGSRVARFTLISMEPRSLERPLYDVELAWAQPARAYVMPEDLTLRDTN